MSRKLTDREVRRLALICAAEQLIELSSSSQHEDSVVEEAGGTEADTAAVREQMRAIAASLLARASRMGEGPDDA